MRTNLLVLCLFALFITGCKDAGNIIYHITLSPKEHKIYSFEAAKPMRIGIVLDQAITGGMVELQQLGSAAEGGTEHHFISRLWIPIEGKIELKLINNSKTKVGVAIFEGNRPLK